VSSGTKLQSPKPTAEVATTLGLLSTLSGTDKNDIYKDENSLLSVKAYGKIKRLGEKRKTAGDEKRSGIHK